MTDQLVGGKSWPLFGGILRAGFLFFGSIFVMAEVFAAASVFPPDISTNEDHPYDSISILNEMPQGTYVTVGGERAFIMMALAKKATRLLIVDRDPRVVKFAKLNIRLLKAARDIKDYQALREKWNLMPLTAGTSGGAFFRANYPITDELFVRLKRLAIQDKISVFQQDLSEERGVAAIAKRLLDSGEPVAMLDLSNAHGRFFLNAKQIQRLVNRVSETPTSNNNALFMMTSYLPRKDDRLFVYTGAFLASIRTRSDHKVSPLIEYLGQAEYIPNHFWKNRILVEADLKKTSRLTRKNKDYCSRTLSSLELFDLKGLGAF